MSEPRLSNRSKEAANRWRSSNYDATTAPRLSGEDPDRIARRLRLKGYTYREASEIIALSRDKPARLEAPSLLERIIAENDLTSVGFLMKGLACTFAVCRIVIKSPGGAIAGFGTGFRISPRLLMTNNHVLSSPAEAALSVAQFDFLEGPMGEPPDIRESALDPGAFFMTSRPLDFTMVALDEERAQSMTAKGRPWLPLIRESGKALNGEPVNIIQHPRGETMRIAFRENKIIGRRDDFIHYATDTEPGSSGSPVMNDEWDLAALHHAGVPRTREDGTVLKRDGTPFVEGTDDPAEIDWIGNEGIRISSLAAHAESQTLSDRETKLLTDAFVPPDWGKLLKRAAAGAFQALSPTTDAPESFMPPSGPVQRADGRTSWFFEISAGPVAAPPAVRAEPPPQAPAPVKRPPRDPGLDARAAAESLLEFLKPRDEPYYDAAADEKARQAYYGQFQPGAADETFDALSRLLAGTHTSPVSYSAGRKKLYAWADAHKSGGKLSLCSIYSGEPMEQIDVIAQELAQEAATNPELLGSIREGNFERYFELERVAAKELMEAAEASDAPPFDCEHVVPQSWFEKKSPMVGDMHHLFTCEKGCNRARGNSPYFDFDEFEGTDQAVPAQERIKDKCGFLGDGNDGKKGFEPQWHTGRGAAARATLYFLLRYPGTIGKLSAKFDQYDEARIAKLLEWHRKHPPIEWEKHRNFAIEKEQGNRNPLVDFPDFQWTAAHFLPGLSV